MTILATIECHEPMGRDRDKRQPWSDVRVTFVDPATRQNMQFEPTLISRLCLERDLAFVQGSQIQNRADDRSKKAMLLRQIIALFQGGAEFFVASASPGDLIPEIYTSSDYIDQPEAERMLAHFLGTLGYVGLGFQWVWPEFIASVG